MGYNMVKAFFTNKKDSEVIASIAGKYACTIVAEETDQEYVTVFQQLVTDWDFIQQRCRKNSLRR